MEREPRRCSCNRGRRRDEIRAEIRTKKKEIAWAVVELVFALALAAAMGALILWSIPEHAKRMHDRDRGTTTRGLPDE